MQKTSFRFHDKRTEKKAFIVKSQYITSNWHKIDRYAANEASVEEFLAKYDHPFNLKCVLFEPMLG